MRTKPHQLQPFRVWLPVDQNQVRFDVTVPVVFPFPGKLMIPASPGQWLIVRQSRDDFYEIAFQDRPVRSFGLPLVVALELAGAAISL